MSDGGYRPADGVALNARLPDDLSDRLQVYTHDPIVHEMVRLYAREHDCPVEDVLYAPTGSIAVGAPALGYPSLEGAVRAQQLLNRALDMGGDRDE